MTHFSKFVLQNVANSKTFPNYGKIAPFLKGIEGTRSFGEKYKKDVKRSLFSVFEAHFVKTWESFLGVKLNKTRFIQFNVGHFSETIDGIAKNSNGEPLVSLLFAPNAEDVAFGVVLSLSTLQAVYDSRIGYDLSKLYKCFGKQDEFLFSSRLSELERRLISHETHALCRLFPLGYERLNRKKEPEVSQKIDWGPVTLLMLDKNNIGECIQGTIYWEERSFEIQGKNFYWSLFIPGAIFRGSSSNNAEKIRKVSSGNIAMLSSDEDKIIPISASDVLPVSGPASSNLSSSLYSNTTSCENRRPIEIERKIIQGRLDPRDQLGNATVEMVVEIASGEVDYEVWNSLQPGCVLSTDVDADKLFTACIDGLPTFYVKPGVYRGVSAVQIKKRVLD